MADYKVTDTELTSIANAIRTKGSTQSPLEFPTGFVSAVNAIPTGGSSSDFDLLSDFNADWSYSGDSWGFVADDVCAITTANSGTGTMCTTTAIDFSNYTKLKLKVDKLAGSYAPYIAQCRLAVSTSPINNSNRGSDYVNLSDGAGEYELTLPSNKSSLYVGIMAWTTSQVLFTKVTAE